MTTTAAIRMTAETAAMLSPRRDRTGGVASGDMRFSDYGGRFPPLLPMHQAKYHGHEHQRGDSSKNQTAHDGAAKRRVLLAAFAEAKGHRRHADNHGQRRHKHRAEADEACIERGLDG